MFLSTYFLKNSFSIANFLSLKTVCHHKGVRVWWSRLQQRRMEKQKRISERSNGWGPCAQEKPQTNRPEPEQGFFEAYSRALLWRQSLHLGIYLRSWRQPLSRWSGFASSHGHHFFPTGLLHGHRVFSQTPAVCRSAAQSPCAWRTGTGPLNAWGGREVAPSEQLFPLGLWLQTLWDTVHLQWEKQGLFPAQNCMDRRFLINFRL